MVQQGTRVKNDDVDVADRTAPPTPEQTAANIRNAADLRLFAAQTAAAIRKSPVRFDKLAFIRTGDFPDTRDVWAKWRDEANARLETLNLIDEGINYRTPEGVNVTGSRAASAIMRDDAAVIKSFG